MGLRCVAAALNTVAANIFTRFLAVHFGRKYVIEDDDREMTVAAWDGKEFMVSVRKIDDK